MLHKHIVIIELIIKGEQHKKIFLLILPLFPHYITNKTFLSM